MLLYQLEDGYCYNSDTHFLYNFVCKQFDNRLNITGNLLDVGSGSGVLGLLLARDYPKLKLSMSEIQPEMMELSKINARVNKTESKIYFGNFLDMEFEDKFDFIVSNPPFYHKNVIHTKNSNKNIARYNHHLPIDALLKKINSNLKPHGILFFCYDAKQLVDIFSLLKSLKINIEAIQYLHPKNDKEASVVFIMAKKSSKSLLKILPPIIMFEDGEFTKETEDVYEKTRTYSIKCKL